MAATTILHQLKAGPSFEDVDVQLAEVFMRRGGDAGATATAVALATSVLSRALREGHSALASDEVLEALREVCRSESMMNEAASLTSVSLLEEALRQSPVVGDAMGNTPLVLADGLLQFRRYHSAEHRIARRVRALMLLEPVADVPGFSIVTGGPGTGKTTYVARRLLELRATGPKWRIALAAPTGKAAARLNESMHERISALGGGTPTDASSDNAARTLHRLLAYTPTTHTFRRNENDPLAEDLVIVDEASMVDVLVLDALLRALKPGARLMLVGDHNQLASVDAGDVLSVFCNIVEEQRGGGATSSEAPGMGANATVSQGAFARVVTRLIHSYRFDPDRGIGELAAAVLAGNVSDVLAACSAENGDEVRLEAPARVGVQLPATVTRWLEECLRARAPDELLQAMEQCRIVAPEWEGRMGVHAINAAVERWLQGRGVAVREQWYHMRPVLIEANDYSAGVFNGDLGVVWRDGGESAVYFRGGDGVRSLAPVRVPAAQTAWAMTVHKSQGSEFDEVVVVVPEHESRVMSRQLLYTAVTRARRRVTLVASAESLRSALARESRRSSGLGRALAAAGDP